MNLKSDARHRLELISFYRRAKREAESAKTETIASVVDGWLFCRPCPRRWRAVIGLPMGLPGVDLIGGFVFQVYTW